MSVPKNIPRTRYWHIVLAAFVLNTISLMDRTNLGFAFQDMQRDLDFDSTISGLAGSVFFIGYFVLELPGGRLADRWSAKRVIVISGLVWGIMAMGTALARNVPELLTIRTLLGFAEGASWPAMVTLLGRWFPARERAHSTSLLMLSVPVSSAVASPLSGWILSATGQWQWMFVIEGALPILWAFAVWFLLADHPADARWLPRAERDYLEQEFAADRAAASPRPASLKAALKDRIVLQLILIYFFFQVGQYGFALWLPTVVRSLSGGSDLEVGLLTAIPWVAGAIGLLLNGNHSDRSGERRYHIAVVVVIGAAFLLVSAMIGASAPIWAMVTLVLAVGFFQAYSGVTWSLPNQVVAPAAVGVVTGLINGVGTIGGGFAGPYAIGYLNNVTGGVRVGQIFLVIMLLLGAFFTVLLPTRRSRARGGLAEGEAPGQPKQAEPASPSDAFG